MLLSDGTRKAFILAGQQVRLGNKQSGFYGKVQKCIGVRCRRCRMLYGVVTGANLSLSLLFLLLLPTDAVMTMLSHQLVRVDRDIRRRGVIGTRSGCTCARSARGMRSGFKSQPR